MKSVDQLIDDILRREGGYNDIAADRGGATNLGISLRYAKGVPEMDLNRDGVIDKRDIMLVTPDVARRLYKRDFLVKPGIDDLDPAVQPQLFDISVNAGGKRAVELLQRALNTAGANLRVDGYSGPATEKATREVLARIGVKDLNNRIAAQREAFYLDIIRRDPSQAKFRNGWLNRAREFRM